MDKHRIRIQMKARKALLDDVEKAVAARNAFELLEKTAAFMLSEHILLYHSLPDELSTREFIERWADRKHFYLPRVNGVNLDVLPYQRSRMHLGAFNIEEPDGDVLNDLSGIDMVIVPAVAYDRHGNRVGRGKGYYDRFFADIGRAERIGIAYGIQYIGGVKLDGFDVPMDTIITEKGLTD